jgi:hypothetical protein
VTRRRRRRGVQVLNGVKGQSRYWTLNEGALDRTLYRTRPGRSCGTFVRQTVELWVDSCQTLNFTPTYLDPVYDIQRIYLSCTLILSFKLWLVVLRSPFPSALSFKNLPAFLTFPQRSTCSTHLHPPPFFTIIIIREKNKTSKLFGTKFCYRWSTVWDQTTDMLGGRVGKFTIERTNSKFSRIRAKWILTCIGYRGARYRGLHATLQRSGLNAIRHRE